MSTQEQIIRFISEQLECVGVDGRLIERWKMEDPKHWNWTIETAATRAQQKGFIGTERRLECNRAARELFELHNKSMMN